MVSLHCLYSSTPTFISYSYPTNHSFQPFNLLTNSLKLSLKLNKNNVCKINCSSETCGNKTLRTCKNCKSQFDPSLNHPLACRFHSAHFGGETKRKFESVYTGGTMNTPNSGQVLEYWHCCGSEDPFDPGCTSSPHLSYDD